MLDKYSRQVRRAGWLLLIAALCTITWAKPRPVVPAAADESGLQFRLSAATPARPTRGSDRPLPRTTPLAPDVAARLLASLPPLPAEPADKTEFRVRERSLPRPRTGDTVPVAFPPAPGPARPPASDGPLTVLRHAPEGNVPLVPMVSVTFSQPMVALSSVAEVGAEQVPARLSPPVPGRWRWVGTQTLVFEPAGQRMPMATTYTVTVPAGVRDATGHVLAKETQFRFTTPPPQVQSFTPQGGPTALDPIAVAVFDQKVDPNAVLKSVKTTPSASLSLVPTGALDEHARELVEAAPAGRAVAFRGAFPANTNVSVTFDAGLASAEGPNKTDRAQSFSFRTYGPLLVLQYGCGWGTPGPPGTPLHVQMSNPLDEKAFRPEQVQVSPAIPGMTVDVRGPMLWIRGQTRGRTRYTVTLAPSLRDVFGQNLGTGKPLAIDVGPAPPSMAAPNGALVTADPYGQPSYTVFTVNQPALRVRMYQVGPDDWLGFVKAMQHVNDEQYPTPPGRKVVDTTVSPKGEPDALTETAIDLRPALKDGLGQVIVVVEPTVQPKDRWRRMVAMAWVQSTRIGLDAWSDSQSLEGWASALVDGAPLEGVTVTISGGVGPSGITAADGRVRLALPDKAAEHRVLVARKGADVAILPHDKYWWSGNDGWTRRPLTPSLRWCVFDDRGLYKPGEQVHFKGWLRRLSPGPLGDIRGLDGDVTSVRYKVVDPRDNEVAKGELKVDAHGGFDGSFTLPDRVNLGQARIELTANARAATDVTFAHAFKVEEFRRPEFEVSTRVAEGRFVIGDGANVGAEAKYYAGGGLINADVTWRVTSQPGSYSPPGYDEYTFGKWVPWFWYDESAPAGSRSKTLAAKTDAAGQHAIRIDFDGVRPAQPSVVTAEATVMDVNRQAWSSSSQLLVHASTQYVGLKRDELFVRPGQPVRLMVVTPDLDGHAVAGRPVSLHAARLDWTWRDGRYQQQESDVEELALTSTAGSVEAVLHPKRGGTWRVRATVADAKGRSNETELLFWVTGGQQPPSRDVSAERVLLVPDRPSYQPGETAHILVQSPFTAGHGMLVLSRGGIAETRPFALEGASATIDVPIDERAVPNLDVQVEVTGSAERAGDLGQKTRGRRPAYALGSIVLKVPPLTRTLKVQARPREAYARPGSRLAVDVAVLDAAGRPAADSQVAMVVVDESVLALTGYKMIDPLAVFYAARNGDVRDVHGRSDVVLGAAPPAVHGFDGVRSGDIDFAATRGQTEREELDDLAADEKTVSKQKQVSASAGKAAPRMRSDFSALALFSPAVKTDAAGKAVVWLKLPDNLTRYRIMAVAVNGDQRFGAGESVLTARLPLMVRPSPPRFLNFGDRAELPVVLQNQTAAPVQVQVAMRASNVKLEGSGLQVTVPANDRVEVRFPVSTALAGTARFQVAARAARDADAAEFSLPVYTPATSEAFATYGVVDGSGAVVQPVKAPSGVYPQFGGLEVEMSSTAVQSLTDAVLYLVRYPFECAEQVSSRVLGIASLRDVLAAFHAKGLPDAQTLEASVAADIEKLRKLQNDDGGFAFWMRGQPSWPYLGVHVANALVRAKAKGYAVPAEMLERSRGYLRSIESHIPSWYPVSVRHAIVAYALNVRWRMGDADVAKARGLVAAGLPASKGNTPTRGTLSVEAVGWLLPLVKGQPESAVLRRFLDDRVGETAGAANFRTSYEDGEYLLLASDRRADAIVLESLVEADPKSDLIPKLVKGLLAHRSRGRWENTQENVFVLLALDKYFNTFEKATPDFVARVWLGDGYAGEQAFKGRSTARYVVSVPMRTVVEGAPLKDLVIGKEGAGRLYYRLAMQYAPRDLDLQPLEAGFSVQRVYEGVDDAADVRREADGAWVVRAGARVRVKVTMVAPSRRYHVALVDPLPAGLEALNPALATQGALPPADEQKANPWWYWMRPWYEHQNLRDERAEAFTSLLWEGVYTYTYYARATTPGQYVVPPAKAEEMYSPEVFGRSATARVVVR